MLGFVPDEWFVFLIRASDGGTRRVSHVTRATIYINHRSQREWFLLLLFWNPRVGEFKQMITTLEAREAEHRKSGESSSYLGWLLPGGDGAPASAAAASPSPAAADTGKRDGNAGGASSSLSSMLFGSSSSSSSAPDDAEAARAAALVKSFNK